MEEVLGMKEIGGVTHYRIKWLNWDASYNSWEPTHHLNDETRNYYHTKVQRKEEKKEAKLAQQEERLEEKKRNKFKHHFGRKV